MNILKSYLIETTELEEKFNAVKSVKNAGKKISKAVGKITSKVGRKKKSSTLKNALKLAGSAALIGGTAGTAAYRYHEPSRKYMNDVAKGAQDKVKNAGKDVLIAAGKGAEYSKEQAKKLAAIVKRNRQDAE